MMLHFMREDNVRILHLPMILDFRFPREIVARFVESTRRRSIFIIVGGRADARCSRRIDFRIARQAQPAYAYNNKCSPRSARAFILGRCSIDSAG